jgi:hypothetical protein
MKLCLVSVFISLVGCIGEANPNELADNPNPSCSYDVVHHDPLGPLLKSPEMHMVFFGSYWLTSTDQQVHQNDWATLLNITGTNNTSVLQRLSEYGIVSGSFDTKTYNEDLGIDLFPNGQLITTQVLFDESKFPINDLNDMITAGILPIPNANTLYTVMLPPHVSTTYLAGGNYVGDHDYGSYNGMPYAYSVIVYSSDIDYMNAIVSHELYEAATNPDGYTGFYGVDTDHEIADICLGQYVIVDDVLVQKVFSETACTCL